MEDDEFPSISPNIDHNKILPIHQKRIVAFINNFVSTTVSFLNTFAHSCESRLMDFEYKLQKIEASLLILESQLSSISGLDPKDVLEISSDPCPAPLELPEMSEYCDDNKGNIIENTDNTTSSSATTKVKDDPTLSKFFKMLHVGVPLQAVKLKMELEGLDPSLLDKLNENTQSMKE